MYNCHLNIIKKHLFKILLAFLIELLMLRKRFWKRGGEDIKFTPFLFLCSYLQFVTVRCNGGVCVNRTILF